ncbi:hypothetical protein ACFZDI_11825 [Streptomyces sp. NPDC007907]|uniref:ABC transporter permease subunit n=1 Tax=Streptomyces sp. NPDC007907 TaxID=3364789 RepID=UPI0036E21895
MNLHFGYTGLLNFGQVGFMLVGGYGLAITVSTYGGPMWLGVLGGIACAIVLALLLGLPTLRLRADYLAITDRGGGDATALLPVQLGRAGHRRGVRAAALRQRLLRPQPHRTRHLRRVAREVQLPRPLGDDRRMGAGGRGRRPPRRCWRPTSSSPATCRASTYCADAASRCGQARWSA